MIVSSPGPGDVIVAAIGSSGGSIALLRIVPAGMVAISSTWQLPSQPSSACVLPSSHCSPGSTTPLPQLARTTVVVVTVDVLVELDEVVGPVVELDVGLVDVVVRSDVVVGTGDVVVVVLVVVVADGV